MKLNRPYLTVATGKCLKVVHETDSTKKTIGDAMMQCSAENGRLAAFSTCDSIKATMEQIHAEYVMDAQNYFIGNFFFKEPEGIFYKNWEENTIIDS